MKKEKSKPMSCKEYLNYPHHLENLEGKTNKRVCSYCGKKLRFWHSFYRKYKDGFIIRIKNGSPRIEKIVRFCSRKCFNNYYLFIKQSKENLKNIENEN